MAAVVAVAGRRAGDSRAVVAVLERNARWRRANTTPGWDARLEGSVGLLASVGKTGSAVTGSTFPAVAIRAAIAARSLAHARSWSKITIQFSSYAGWILWLAA